VVVPWEVGAFPAMPSRWTSFLRALSSVREDHMQHVKWLAFPLALLGLVFLFFGLIWTGAVQFGVAVALLSLAAVAW
jgi:hypothetical protein